MKEYDDYIEAKVNFLIRDLTQKPYNTDEAVAVPFKEGEMILKQMQRIAQKCILASY